MPCPAQPRPTGVSYGYRRRCCARCCSHLGLYSQRNFSDFWAGQVERQREHYRREYGTSPLNTLLTAGCELPVYDLGVNILVYALTREGSLAQKPVAAE